jgi:hypothetical protein
MIIKVKDNDYLGIPLYRCTLCLSENRGKKSMVSHTVGCKYLESKSKKIYKTKKKHKSKSSRKKTKKKPLDF